jgi:ribonuclease HI
MKHIAPQSEFGFVLEKPHPTKINGKQWVAYTDGSCLKNPGGPGGWSFLLFCDGKAVNPSCLISDHLPETTSNRAELIAVIRALQAVPENTHIEILSDSRYVVNGANCWTSAWAKRKWKNVKNADLWQELVALKDKRHCKFTWLRGHAGDQHNERCDRLAGAAAERRVV